MTPRAPRAGHLTAGVRLVGLTKRYGDVGALESLSLDVAPGERRLALVEERTGAPVLLDGLARHRVDVAATAARYDAWGHLAKPFAKEELAHLLEEATGAPRRLRIKGMRDVSRDVSSVFHDYWNLVAALSNYIALLDEAKNLPPALRKYVTGLDEVVLQLESKTDRLQSFLRGVLASVEPASKHGPSEPVAGAA